MKSLIFDVQVRILKPIIWLIAFALLARGHDHLGGGFAAGIVAALAPILQILSGGSPALRPWHRERLLAVLGGGLLVLISSGIRSLSGAVPFMTAKWLPGTHFSLGTPTLFDLGIAVIVYAVVGICVGQLLAQSNERPEL